MLAEEQVPHSCEERFVSAGLQLELLNALQKDLQADEARTAEKRKKKSAEAIHAKRGLTDLDSRLEEYIQKVNEQADWLNDLRNNIANDKRRCLKAGESLDERSNQADAENQQIENLVNQLSSLSITDINTGFFVETEQQYTALCELVQSELSLILTGVRIKTLALLDMQRSLEALEEKGKKCVVMEEENSKRRDAIDQTVIQYHEELEFFEELDKNLQELETKGEKSAREIDAANECISSLEIGIDGIKTEMDNLVLRETNIDKDLNEVEEQRTATKASALSSESESNRLAEEYDALLKAEERHQWEKRQQQQRQLKEWKESNEVLQQSEGLAREEKLMGQSETEAGDNVVPPAFRPIDTATQSNTKQATRPEAFNETNNSIIFDPVQLVASTPMVSPKRADSNQFHVPLRRQPRRKSKCVKEAPRRSNAPPKRQTKAGARKNNRNGKESAEKKPCTEESPSLEKRNVYDMFDSE